MKHAFNIEGEYIKAPLLFIGVVPLINNNRLLTGIIFVFIDYLYEGFLSVLEHASTYLPIVCDHSVKHQDA